MYSAISSNNRVESNCSKRKHKKIVHLFTGKQIMSRIETYNVKTLKMMQACKQVH